VLFKEYIELCFAILFLLFEIKTFLFINIEPKKLQLFLEKVKKFFLLILKKKFIQTNKERKIL